MQTFNPMQYLAIDIANSFGLDKVKWQDRLDWVNSHYNDLESLTDKADDKFLYIKGVKTLREVEKGNPTGFIMGLDATASGYQIMACLSGCKKTASAVNLVNTGNREDIYSYIANHMNSNYGTKVTRDMVKRPIMTLSYGSKAQPRALFGEDTPELKAFYGVLNNNLYGAMTVMDLILDCWNSKAYSHSYKLPDGHVVYLPTVKHNLYSITINEGEPDILFKLTENEPDKNGTNLIANVVHSIDGYIVREMVRKARKQGFQLAHIHDSFWTSPVYMNEVRRNYVEILANIADSNLLENILSQITGKKVEIEKDSDNLGKLIRKSEYALS
jgi:DNA-directed RNA polymerase